MASSSGFRWQSDANVAGSLLADVRFNIETTLPWSDSRTNPSVCLDWLVQVPLLVLEMRHADLQDATCMAPVAGLIV